MRKNRTLFKSMVFEIHSHEGVGPVWFGMTRAAVRMALGGEVKTIQRTPDDDNPNDSFKESHCFVHYDEDGKAEAVEFYEPASPIFNGVNLLGLGFTELIKQIRNLDPLVSLDGDGYTSLNLGIGGFAPAAEDEPDLPPESAIVFVRGYYD